MSTDKIEDAEVVAGAAAESASQGAIETVEDTIETVGEKADDAIEAADDRLAEEFSAEDAPVEEIVEESTTSDPDPLPEEVAAAPESQRSSGFFPMLLGGLVAGGIGYGISYFQNGSGGTDLSAEVAAQSETVAKLQDGLSGFASTDAVTTLGDTIAANGAQITELGARIDEGFASLEERVDVLERQPSADGTLQETAIAAFENDMTELRDQIIAQKDELSAQMAAQQEELSEVLNSTRAEAQSIEESAIASARAATARASLAVIQGALESGAPFGAAVADLGGSVDEPVPAALADVAETGVPTLAAIQEQYPDAARAALAVARSEGASGEESSGLGGFLRNQFDVRSVEPQEGDSADAVLSRTEAALKDGRLNDALAEAASLPEVARGAMSDWTALAEQRAAALDAANTLASQLNVN